ncbi:MAG: M28 family peptidase [Terriglobales bacterium]
MNAEAKPQPHSVTAATPAAELASIPDPGPLPRFDGAGAMQFTRQVVAFGPRWPGSAGYRKLQRFLRAQLKADNLEEDTFTASTPAGPLRMTNFIAKYPGTKDGIIVVAGHYDTLYGRTNFAGANDGGSSTGLLLQLAKDLRAQMSGGKLQGYSVWLVWLDGEEAIRQWSDTDSLYGSRHLAEKWQQSGVLGKIKGFILVDMIGDADLNIVRDVNSTQWMGRLVWEAARRYGYQSHFFAQEAAIQDDHIPFVMRGVPAVDLIDFDYGYNNAYWHTKDDTLDKLSPRSFELAGSVVAETIRLLDLK